MIFYPKNKNFNQIKIKNGARLSFQLISLMKTFLKSDAQGI